MDQIFSTATVGSAIQSALAPVFLLTAIGAMLNVMVQRLSRVVDRARHLETHMAEYSEVRRRIAMDDLAVLAGRMTSANWAIALCILSALLVCCVIVLLFVEQLVGARLDIAIAWLFIAATLFLTGGLSLFLWEVQLALRSVRVRAAEMMSQREE